MVAHRQGWVSLGAGNCQTAAGAPQATGTLPQFCPPSMLGQLPFDIAQSEK